MTFLPGTGASTKILDFFAGLCSSSVGDSDLRFREASGEIGPSTFAGVSSTCSTEATGFSDSSLGTVPLSVMPFGS